MHSSDIVETDVLVVGGGGAASRAAMSASDQGAAVVMAVKGEYGSCGSTANAFAETTMITGAPLDGESDGSLYKDTFAAAMGVISPDLVRVLVRDCGERVRDLERYGLKLHRKVYADLFSSGFAHSTPRTFIVESRLERDVLIVLVKEVMKRPIKIMDHIQVARLLVEDGKVVGALGVGKDDIPVLFKAGSVILANGGAHGLFPHHPSSGEMIGDSFAMAYHAGLTMVNMDIIQMGPVGTKPVKRILSAPNWRLKPVLTNAAGEEFLEKYLPEGVSSDEIFRIAEFPYTVRTDTKYLNRAIYTEIMEGRGDANRSVRFDVTRHSAAAIREKAPFTYDLYKAAGHDLAATPLPLSIGVQTFHGGCLIDARSATGIDRLFACGEAAGGLMGAERPGGNALAECQVFGAIAGREAAAALGGALPDDARLRSLADRVLEQTRQEAVSSFAEIRETLRTLMFETCLTVRNGEKLERALTEIAAVRNRKSARETGLRDHLSACNALTAAELIMRSSLERRESRGCHYRDDCPQRDEAYNRPIAAVLRDGGMAAGLRDLW